MILRRGLIVVVVLAFAVGIYLIEWVEISVDAGYGSEAIKNPFLAAQQFGEQYDIDSRISDGFASLDDLSDAQGALVFSSARRVLSPSRAQAVLDWVERGGHLIVVATMEWDDDTQRAGDPVLDPVGIQLHSTFDLDEANDERRETDSGYTCIHGESVADVPASGRALAARFTSDYYLSAADDDEIVANAINEAGQQLLQVYFGDGLVTVMTSMALWRNASIGCHDHAHLFRLLVGDGASVSWVVDVDMAPLWELVWRNFPLLIMGLALALVLWLWNRMFRAGPIVATVQTRRRAMLDHVRGNARFLWQQEGSDRLLAAMRREVLPRRESLDDRVHQLALQSPHDEATIRWALTVEIGRDHAAFVRAVRILRELRNTK